MCKNYKELKETIKYCINECDDDLEDVIRNVLYLTSFDEIEIVEALEYDFGFDMSWHPMSSNYCI